MPSGKQSKRRRQAQASAPPPVRSKGGASGISRLSGRNLWFLGGGAAIAVVVVILAIALSGGSAKPVHVDFAQMSGLQTDPPPWNNGVGELQDRLAAVHLNRSRKRRSPSTSTSTSTSP